MAARRKAFDESAALLEYLDGRISSAEADLDRAQRVLKARNDPARHDPGTPRTNYAAAKATAAAEELRQFRWMRGVTAALVRRAQVADRRPPAADAEGLDMRPDPMAATTGAELAAALAAYRVWAGEPSFRDLAAMAVPRMSASTLCTALGSDRLPRLEVVMAVIAGCGGSEEEQRRWASAWRRIRFVPEDRPAAMIRGLRAVPAAAATG